jgi:hypothetical protein
MFWLVKLILSAKRVIFILKFADYLADEELTAFTVLDKEDF